MWVISQLSGPLTVRVLTRETAEGNIGISRGSFLTLNGRQLPIFWSLSFGWNGQQLGRRMGGSGCRLGCEKGPQVRYVDPVCVQEDVRLALNTILREYLEKHNREHKIGS